MTDAALCPDLPTLGRLGELARPAAGRLPVERFVFAACTVDAIDHTRNVVTQRLEARVGPLRCTEVAVEVAVGEEDTAELLAELNANRGQSAATLNGVVHAYGQVAAAAGRLGLGDAVLVVASCGALTAQPASAVWAS